MRAVAALLSLACAVSVHGQGLTPLAGSWLFVPTNATQLALFAEVALEVTVSSPTAFVAALTWNSGDGTLVSRVCTLRSARMPSTPSFIVDSRTSACVKHLCWHKGMGEGVEESRDTLFLL